MCGHSPQSTCEWPPWSVTKIRAPYDFLEMQACVKMLQHVRGLLKDQVKLKSLAMYLKLAKKHSRLMFVATKNDSSLKPLPISATVKTCFCILQACIKLRWHLISTTCSTRIPSTPHDMTTASTHLNWFRSPFVPCPLFGQS